MNLSFCYQKPIVPILIEKVGHTTLSSLKVKMSLGLNFGNIQEKKPNNKTWITLCIMH